MKKFAPSDLLALDISSADIARLVLTFFDQTKSNGDIESFQLAVLKANGGALQYIDNQTPKLIHAALYKDGNAIEFVRKQTEEYCNLATLTSPLALTKIKNQSEKNILNVVSKNGPLIANAQFQTDAIKWAAIREDGMSIRYIEHLTKEMIFEAIDETGLALEYIYEQDDEIICRAVRHCPEAYAYVINKSDRIYQLALEENSEIIHFAQRNLPIKERVSPNTLNKTMDQSEDLILEYVQQSFYSLKQAKFQTHKICLTAVTAFGHSLAWVLKKTEDIVIAAIKNDYSAMAYVSNTQFNESFFIRCMNIDGRCLGFSKMRTPAIELAAVKQTWKALQYITEPTEQLCTTAYEQDVRALRFLWSTVGFDDLKTGFSLKEIVKRFTSELTIDELHLDILNAHSVQREMECSFLKSNEERNSLNLSTKKNIDVF